MRNIKNKAFTLVELLVVITILAIISVVAYQNFGGAVDKAVSGRKIGDVSTIETSLQQYKSDKNYYPPVDIYDADTNRWGYNSGTTAFPSNVIDLTYDGQEVDLLGTVLGGGKVYGTGTWSVTATKRQIGAKGTISIQTLGKKYLSKDLYDPELGDIKITGSGNMIEYGVGRYVYATYKKNKTAGGVNSDWVQNYNGVNYNIAFTIRSGGSDEYETKIVGDYDEESCYDDKALCPPTLIGSGTVVLTDGQKDTGLSDSPISGIPYYVTDFKAN